jgi:Protein of unknown function (DUF3828)
VRLTIPFLMAISLARAETSAPAQAPATPEATVQRFYKWYLHALNQNQDPLEKNQAELSKFVTQRLMKSLRRAIKRPDGIDADFFIDAQDWDEAWEKNISVTKATIQGEQATVGITLKGGPGFVMPTIGCLVERYFTSLDVMSIVIMNPFVPLYSNGLSPTR